MKKIIVASALILAMASLLTACSSSSPQKTAQKYLNALVAGDVGTIESCKLPLSKSLSSTYKEAARGVTNSLYNIDLSDAGMNSIAGLFLSYTFSGYEFVVTGAKINGKSAKAYFDIFINGTLSRSNEYIPLTQYNGDWYVDFSGYSIP